MARGKPALWSGVVSIPFIIGGIFSYLFQTQIPSSVGGLAIIFGIIIFIIGIYVQFVSEPKPALGSNEEVLEVRHPSQRVALAKIIVSTPFLVGTAYLLFYTKMPYMYPTITFLVGLFFFSKGMHTYWSNSLTRYYITNRRVVRAFKFVSKITQEIPVDKMRGIQERKSIIETVVGLGNVRVASGAGGGTLEIVIRNIDNSKDFAQELRNIETYYSWDSKTKKESKTSTSKESSEPIESETTKNRGTDDGSRKKEVQQPASSEDPKEENTDLEIGAVDKNVDNSQSEEEVEKSSNDGVKSYSSSLDGDDAGDNEVLSEFSDKWYVPESDVYDYAVVNPDGDNTFYKDKNDLEDALERWYGDKEGRSVDDVEISEEPESEILNEYSDKWKLSEESDGFKVLGPEGEVKSLEYQEDLENLLEWWYDADWDIIDKYSDNWNYNHTFNQFEIVFADGTMHTFGTAEELASKLNDWYE